MTNLYKEFPTLYKKSGKKVQQWKILAFLNDDQTAFTLVEHGQVDGAKQTTRVNYTEGKNLGRANATNTIEQCCLEAQSKWNKQKDKGYTENPNGKADQIVPFVMRAYKYKDYKNIVSFPAKLQPKFDGMRCVSIKRNGVVELWSRGQKPITTAPHICEVLNHIMNENEVFDGELYVHDMHLQLQVSLFKKFDPENYKKLTYRVYDTILDVDYDRRYQVISNRILSNKHILNGYVDLSPTWKVENHEQIIEHHNNLVNLGYEGAMLRWGDCPYEQNKQSRKLLKVKEFMDDEFEIIGAKENSGKMEGTCTLICKTKEGAEFDVMPKGSQSLRKQYWEDYKQGKLIGKMLTVRFFEWTASDPPKPKHGTGVAIRDYE